MARRPSSMSWPRLPNPAAATIRRWRARPARFVTEAFGATPEKWQGRALDAVADHDRVAIRSGHGVGKSAFLSWLVLWWLATRYPAKVPCTAPSAHQLQDVLWAEIARWHRRMPPALRDQFVITRDRVALSGAGGGSAALARTARKETPEAFQGFHADNLLFVVDEASGVEDAIFEAGQGAMSTAGAKTVMAGNPTRNSGAFFDVFHRDRERWTTMRVPCADSSLVAPAYAEEVAAKYGRDSNVYRVRVLGEFPRADDDVVIPLDLAEAAIGRDVAQSGAMVWGVDVARFGDDRTALARRHGNHQAGPVESWRGKDIMQTAGLVAAAWARAPLLARPRRIVVDAIGLGAGVADRLAELGLPAVALNVAEQAAAAERYLRLRDELWFRARDWLHERRCRLEDDPALIGELTAPRFGFTSTGRLRVEAKDEMKRRGLASPDLADAFVLTFAVDPATPLRPIRAAYAEGAYDPFA